MWLFKEKCKQCAREPFFCFSGFDSHTRVYVSFCFFSPCVWVLPCLFQRCPLMEREVTAFLEILEEVGVISTWMLRAPSLLLLFSAAPCSDDLMALPTWGRGEAHTHWLYCFRWWQSFTEASTSGSQPVRNWTGSLTGYQLDQHVPVTFVSPFYYRLSVVPLLSNHGNNC